MPASSSVTQTGKVAIIRGAGLPAAAAASLSLGFMCSLIVFGPTQAREVPSANLPVTASACGPSAATTIGHDCSGLKKVVASQEIISPLKETLPSLINGTSTDKYSFRCRMGRSKGIPKSAIITSWDKPIPKVNRDPIAACNVCTCPAKTMG